MSTKHQFSSGTYYGSIPNFVPKDFFKCYDYYELYDETKEYITDIFEHDYGTGIGVKTYCLSAHHINDQFYVTACEYLSEADQQELKEFCQCAYHQKYWFNPVKYFICRCCVGCLHSDMPGQNVIYRTREFMAKQF